MAYVLELCLFILPLLTVQVINNALLSTWSIEAILSLFILGLNLALDIRGIIVVSDDINAEKTTSQLQAKIRQH